MYAIEFETDIKDKFIEIQNYEKLINKHVRVIVLVSDNTEPNHKQQGVKDIRLLKLFSDAKNIKIDKHINIFNICKEMNNDIF